jgi:predicted permease
MEFLPSSAGLFWASRKKINPTDGSNGHSSREILVAGTSNHERLELDKGNGCQSGVICMHLLQDLRQTLRQFRNQPGFVVIAVLVLGLGLGANAAIFSVVNGILLHAVPYADPARLVVIYERDVTPGAGRASISYADFEDYRDQARSFESLAIAREMQFNLAGDGRAAGSERIDGAICSWSLLPTLGNQPLLGRVLTAADDRPGAVHVAVISYSLWQSRFGGARDILGQQLRLDSEDYEIVGVMPGSFSFPRPGSKVWVPALPAIGEQARTRRGWRQFHGLARLRAGSSIDQARIELDGIAHRLKVANPGTPMAEGALVFPLQEYAVQNVRTALIVLFGAVVCVLLIACVNIANLLLARASGRQREMAIRAAIGASRGRLIRQLLTESLLLALAGAAFGLLLSTFLINALAAAAPALVNRGAIQPTGEVRLDVWVFLFTALVAVGVGIGVGIVPAFRISRIDLVNRLKDGNRSVTAGRAHSAFRSALVSAEMALSLVLLIAAGLMLRSFIEIRAVRPGVRTDNLLTAGISLPVSRYQTSQQVAAFADELKLRLSAVPGVRAADISTCLPVDGFCGDQFFTIDGRTLPPGHMLDANNWAVSPEFFQTMGIPILRGRAFTAQDSQRAGGKSNRYTAIINESMAKKFWPGEDPIGHTIHFGDGPEDPRWEIVGVCGDVVSGLDREPEPAYFVPFSGWHTFYAVVATTGRPEALSIAVLRVIGSLDPDVPAFKVRTMREVAEGSSSNRRFSALLIGLFASTALLLAAIGLYGVFSNLVSQRIGEIGIRMVLGATRTEVQRMMLEQGMRPVFAGLAGGLAAALAVTRLLRSLLFGVTPTDPTTFAVVSLLLIGVALLACALPTWRAARIDPAVALRYE